MLINACNCLLGEKNVKSFFTRHWNFTQSWSRRSRRQCRVGESEETQSWGAGGNAELGSRGQRRRVAEPEATQSWGDGGKAELGSRRKRRIGDLEATLSCEARGNAELGSRRQRRIGEPEATQSWGSRRQRRVGGAVSNAKLGSWRQKFYIPGELVPEPGPKMGSWCRSRGVKFEFRLHSRRFKSVWDLGLIGMGGGTFFKVGGHKCT